MRQLVPFAGTVVALLTLLGVGSALRVAELDLKPMHTDEAVQAVKFGQLLEDGYYRYDPAEYHGPTLYYLSLLPARVAGVARFSSVSESLLRGVTVAFGLGLLLLLPLLKEGLGRPGILAAALLTAVSPIMVYFSRYYIQETLLVFFTLGAMGCGWRYVLATPRCGGRVRPPSRNSPGDNLEGGGPPPPRKETPATISLSWALLTGLFLGLMHATKETAIIPFAAWGVALGVPLLRHRKALPLRPLLAHAIAAAIVAVAVSALFYSSMFTHARGPLDSFLAYFNFADRAGGQGHEKPWHYYLSILAWHRQAGFRSSELFILILAAAGGALSFARTGTHTFRTWLGRFLALYCILLFAIYSAIPYKTPWIMLGCVHGAILLAGVAVATLWDRFTHPAARVAMIIVLLAGSTDLARQAWAGSIRYGADDRNPYAYSHTSTDCLRLIDRVHAIARLHPEGRRMTVKVMAEEYWPLPWYLRDLARVGYWNQVPEDPLAPVVITSPALADAVEAKLGEGYVADLAGLRPGVFLVAYIRSDLWNRLIGGDETSEGAATHSFAHYAMGTEFEIAAAWPDRAYAGQAAQAAFVQLDRIDAELSHYLETSDVSQLNRLKPGETLRIGDHAMRCLVAAREMHDATFGAFDVTVGRRMNAATDARASHEGPAVTGMKHLTLDPMRHELRVAKADLRVDLGGIGKGYSLDRMSETLADWGLTNVLLRASASTVLARGTPGGDAEGWAVTRSHEGTKEEIRLADRAMSSSGRGVQGDHIIDPRSGRPATHRTRAWVTAQDATTADALSTAIMVMTDEEVRRASLWHRDVEVVVLDAEPDSEPREILKAKR